MLMTSKRSFKAKGKTNSMITKSPRTKKKNLDKMSVSDFMGSGFNSDSAESDIEDGSKNDKSENGFKPKAINKEMPTSHKKNMDTLKSVDPSFYKYLEQNDQDLLNFDDLSDGDDDDIEDPVHRPPEKLEVASDESDFEAETEDNALDKNAITLKMIEKWEAKLEKDKSTKTLTQVVEAFNAALQSVSHDTDPVGSVYRVEGSSIFNAVLRLCVLKVSCSVKLILKPRPGMKGDATKHKSWVKVRRLLLNYFEGLTKLCAVTSPEVLTVLLKHIHEMLPYAVPFANLTLRLMRRFIILWTSESDVVRVLAFLCLLRIANLRRSIYKTALKKMYFAFVRNSKFVSPTNQPAINFMRQSLAEMFVLDPNNSYEPAFLYIRQLTIHLRNAITLKKKEHYQAVQNWQFIESLHLWTEVLGLAPKDSALSRLIHPVVQITLGTIDLIPSAEFYPLRFHCAKYLVSLSKRTGVFIPVIPIILEVLRNYDFNRKHKKLSMKPMDLKFVLRVSKLQRQENGFKDATIDLIHAILLEAFAIEAHRLSFPDTVVPAVIQMKQFLKNCKVSKYCKQIKSITDKVLENSKMVEAERSKAGIRLDDTRGIAAVEALIRSKGPPIFKYYKAWAKIHQQQTAKRAFNNDQMADYKLPTLYKFEKKRAREREEGPVELFPDTDSDSDGDGPDLPVEAVKPKKAKDKVTKSPAKKRKATEELILPDGCGIIDTGDVIEDLIFSDLE